MTKEEEKQYPIFGNPYLEIDGTLFVLRKNKFGDRHLLDIYHRKEEGGWRSGECIEMNKKSKAKLVELLQTDLLL